MYSEVLCRSCPVPLRFNTYSIRKILTSLLQICRSISSNLEGVFNKEYLRKSSQDLLVHFMKLLGILNTEYIQESSLDLLVHFLKSVLRLLRNDHVYIYNIHIRIYIRLSGNEAVELCCKIEENTSPSHANHMA